MKENGKVYLIGAGPGDPGLISVKALMIIQKADIIIYDHLVNTTIIDTMVQPGCIKKYVGKQGNDHTLSQAEINCLLVETAQQYHTVVRLKGGDPFIFGRGGEEALHLADQHIDFEIINGISSAYAVPSYAGIPVTHRTLSSSVAFVTGHEDPTKDSTDINWKELTNAVQTLVFLMGVKNLPVIIDNLIKNGRDKQTPVAVIENGTYASQRTVTGTLDTIIHKVEAAAITPPAIIVVGSVVSLRERINWFEKKPLFNKRIIVTRSRSQASDLVTLLHDAGGECIEVPAINIIPVTDKEPVIRAINTIGTFDWIIFTSVNGVEAFFNYLFEQSKDSRDLAYSKVCAIGPATGKALMQYGIKPDLMPETYLSSKIIELFTEKYSPEGKKFLLPRADIAPDELPRTLHESGAACVEQVVVYSTVRDDTTLTDRIVHYIKNRKFDLVTFTSSSTVTNFSVILNNLGINDFSQISCAAIGPVTANAAKEFGFNLKIEAQEHTIPGLVHSIIEHFN